MYEYYINDKMLEKIKKILGEDTFKEWNIQKKANLNKNIKISNTGLVSSGKSTLFNVLTNNIDNERFPTGAARTTSTEDVEKIFDDVYIVDTPGIDVKTSDDEKAYMSVLSSDIIIIVHNIKLGMLNKQECDWIKNICSHYPNLEERKDRIMFVCSWIDERDSEKDYKETIEITKKMLFDITGIEIDFYEVSSKRYITGMKKDSQNLKNKSNILNFKEELNKKVELVSKKYGIGIKKATLLSLINDTENKLNLLKKQKNEEKNHIYTYVSKFYIKKKRAWQSKFEVLQSKLTKIENLKNELKNI